MKIAILLSTYNGEKYLKEQLDSITTQTLVEYIHVYVRDDGSTDATLNILEEYSSKVNMTIFKGNNIGPALSFWEMMLNKDIQAEYYAFCDQDDVWDVDKVEKGVTKLERMGENTPALYCANCRIIDSNGALLFEKMNENAPDFSIISQIVCGSTQGCAMIFNDELRRYISEKQIKKFPMHDFVLVTYAKAAGQIFYDHTPSFSYRVHANNVIAKSGKTFLESKMATFNRWFSKEHRNEVSSFSKTLYEDNFEKMDDETRGYIQHLFRCKKNILERLIIIFDKKTFSNNKRAEISFKIRVALGII